MGERALGVRELAAWAWVCVVVCALACTGLSGCGSENAENQKKAGTETDSAKVDSTQVDTTKAAQEKEEKKKVPEGVPVKVDSVVRGEISSYLLEQRLFSEIHIHIASIPLRWEQMERLS